MKIAIQTLTLHTNYGGILQAYALQTVLQRMGHEVFVLHKERNQILYLLKAPFVWTRRFIKRYILADQQCIIFAEQQHAVMSQYAQSFIDRHIHKLPCTNYSYASLPKNCVDVIVVGSDQVWRPAYFGEEGIGDAYLAFARDWDIKRIAYAASFGTDEWEYSQVQTALCKQLISGFDAVSVREDSAVKLCETHYDLAAQHVLDPTMLLDKADYMELVAQADVPKSLGNLLVYILDETPDKQAVVDAVAQSKGLTPFKVNSKVEDRQAPLADRIQPPLEQWLRGFMDAEFVIADSFHACVFAIIFNKPFIAYGNQARGASRFHSLLKLFGLEKQFIASSAELNLQSCGEIDWTALSGKYKALKQSSLRFLENAL